MPRVALDLNTDEGRGLVNGQWKVAEGYVPGEPNEGLQSQVLSSPARLADYDDFRLAGLGQCQGEPVRRFYFRLVPDIGGSARFRRRRINPGSKGLLRKRTSTTTVRSGSMARSTGPRAPLSASTRPTGWKLTRMHRRETGTSSRSWCSTAHLERLGAAFSCVTPHWRLRPAARPGTWGVAF